MQQKELLKKFDKRIDNGLKDVLTFLTKKLKNNPSELKKVKNMDKGIFKLGFVEGFTSCFFSMVDNKTKGSKNNG